MDLQRLAHALMAQKKFGAAQKLLDETLTPEFAKTQPGLNLLLTWVEMMGRRACWQEATTDAALLVQNQPADHYNFHRLAGLLAITQNRPAYEQLCKKLVLTFTNTTNPYVDERMAQDCLLLPHSGVDLQLMDKVADASIEYGSNTDSMPYFQACKAMSTYRLGKFPEAIEWAEKTTKSSQVPAQAKAYAISAMAHWQLGHKDAALAMLAKGDTLVPSIPPGHDVEDLGASWVAWLMARISLDEATALIQSGPTIDGHSN